MEYLEAQEYNSFQKRYFRPTCMSYTSKKGICRLENPNSYVRWHPPPPNFIKLNFDGSLINNSSAGDFYLRDWTGKLIKVGATHYGETSILVAEARALTDGVTAATFMQVLEYYYRSDNNIIIHAV